MVIDMKRASSKNCWCYL